MASAQEQKKRPELSGFKNRLRDHGYLKEGYINDPKCVPHSDARVRPIFISDSPSREFRGEKVRARRRLSCNSLGVAMPMTAQVVCGTLKA